MAFNLLIVDDSSSMRNIIKKTLEMASFNIGQTFEAGNGREALEVLEKNWVDVILTDVHMPEMDGFDFLAALNAEGVMSETPVVIVTTEGREERIDELISMGAKACINKPFKPEKIKETLLNVLGMGEEVFKENAELGGCDF